MKTLFPFIFLIWLSSCFQTSEFDTCNRETEKLARVEGREKCVPICSKKSDCTGDEICTESLVCGPPGSEIIIVIPPDKVDAGMKDDTSLPIIITDEAAEKACVDFHEKVGGCFESQCPTYDTSALTSLNAAELEECKQDYKTDPESQEAINTAIRVGCSDSFWKDFYCWIELNTGCEICEPPTTVGDPCVDSAVCETGDFAALCATGEVDVDDVPGGYCVGACSDPLTQITLNYSYENNLQCGTGNICRVRVENVQTRFGTCIKGCSRHDECRPGYGCFLEFEHEKVHRSCVFPTTECDPTVCKASEGRSCVTEIGPAGEEFSVCAGECTTVYTPICLASNGKCEVGTNGKSYCVLP